MGLFGSKKSASDNQPANQTKSSDTKVKAKNSAVKEKTKEVKSESSSTKDLYTETQVKGSSKTKGPVKFSEFNQLLVRPLVTEKATTLATDNKYVFVVAKKANKISVAKAIQAVYGVKPTDVNIVNMKGKRVSRGRIRGQRKDWKKAIVTLAKGETIAIYEGV